MIDVRLKYENKIKAKIEAIENRIQTEVRFYEKFSNTLEAFNFFPEYHGYFKEVSLLGRTTYHIFFSFYQKNLRDVIKKKAIHTDLKKIKDYFYQLIEILAYLQTLGIAHRDIKPENILLDDKEERVVLTDFGIAVKVKEVTNNNNKFSGTYYSPEWMKLRYEQKNAEASGNFNMFLTDSFNLGLVVLEMAGISVNFGNNKNFNEYCSDLDGRISRLFKKFEKEINETEENKVFYNDLLNLLKIKPGERSDFMRIFGPRWSFDSEDKLKYHIFVEDFTNQELYRFSLKKVQKLKEIYESLDLFLIHLENPEKEEFFTLMIKKHRKLIENLSFLNHPKALLFKGIQAKIGIDMKPDSENAKLCFEKSISYEENPYSLLFLGLIHDEDKEYEKSFKYFEKAASLKNVFGIRRLGFAFIKGNGCKADPKKGLSLIDQSTKFANNAASIFWKEMGTKRANNMGTETAKPLIKEKGDAEMKPELPVVIQQEQVPNGDAEGQKIKLPVFQKLQVPKDQEKENGKVETKNEDSKITEKPLDANSSLSEDFLYMAKVAESAERYSEMKEYVEKLIISIKSQIWTSEIRNLFETSCKQMLQIYKTPYRSLISLQIKEQNLALFQEYRRQIETEAKLFCIQTLKFIDENIKIYPLDQNTSDDVLLLRLKGDFLRAIAELSRGKEFKKAKEEAGQIYKQALEVAEKLLPVNPIRLGLYLNYSVYLYEIEFDREKALNIAQSAFDGALQALELGEDKEYKNATIIMQVIRDNLTLWAEESVELKEKELKYEEEIIVGSRLQNISSLSREELRFLAVTAEKIERYRDMNEFMKKLAAFSKGLTDEERNLLSISFKNLTGERRAAQRTIRSQIEKGDTSSRNVKMLKDYKIKVDNEIVEISNQVVALVDNYLIINAQNPVEKVFYFKWKGDAYRWMAETGLEICAKANELSGKNYKDGIELAKNELKATNPVRLGLALNYSVYLYEIANLPNMASEVAKKAFDEAIVVLDSINEDEYKDATTIMQLLRDNLTLWTAEGECD